MNKFRQIIVGAFIVSMLIVTQGSASSKTINFDGVVTLHPDILSLLDTCAGNYCPSIQIQIREQNVYGSAYASVSYNEANAQYEYHTTIYQDNAVDDNFSVTINISNGDMGGSEYLYYDFGQDMSIGEDDTLLHSDEIYDENYNSLVHHLEIASEETYIALDIDLSNKNEDRQIITGQVQLPEGMQLGTIYDENDSYVRSNSLSIVLTNPIDNKKIYTSLNRSADANDIPENSNGLFTFILNIKLQLDTPYNTVLNISGTIDDISINTTYQIGEDDNDLDDHIIDGDEKLVSRMADLNRDYASFSNALADFGVISMDTYFANTKTLHGSIIWPSSLLITAHDSSVTLTVESEFGILGTYESRIYKGIEKPANVKHPFEIVVPQDLQDKELYFSLYLWSTDNQGYRLTYSNAYNFGTDQGVGGTDDDLDHLNEPCEAFYTANPLTVDYTSTLPVIDINLANFEPVSSHAAITIIPIPAEVKNMSLSLADMSCPNEPVYTPFRYNEPVGDGWYMDTYSALFSGHDYALVTNYTVNNQEVTYMANDNDHNYTNGGVYLTDMKWIDNPNGSGNEVLDTAFVPGGENINLSPFEFIVPTKKLSPAIIMYLLN